MARCMPCSQENCGRLSPACSCDCHGTKPKIKSKIKPLKESGLTSQCIMDREKISKFMSQTRLRVVIIRTDGRYYFCERVEGNTAWENQPFDDVRIIECPAPIEIVG